MSKTSGPLVVSGSQSSSPILSVTNAASTPSIESLLVTSQSAGDGGIGVRVTGDTARRLSVDSTGKLNWGTGSAAPDVNLYRVGTSTLQTDGSLLVGLISAMGVGLQIGGLNASLGGGVGALGLTNATTVPTTNPSGGLIIYSDKDGPRWRSSNGDIYTSFGSWRDDLARPTAAIAETMPRWNATAAVAPAASAALTLMPIWLPKGITISSITWFSVGAATTPTHQWASLHNASRVQLAVTGDKTTTAIAANTAFTWNIATIATGASTTFVTTYSGLYYLGIMIAASTLPTLVANTLQGGNTAPTSGTSDLTQTTPPAFPHTATAPTETKPMWAYMYVS